MFKHYKQIDEEKKGRTIDETKNEIQNKIQILLANNREKVWEQFPDTFWGTRFFQIVRRLESTKSRIEKSGPMNIL